MNTEIIWYKLKPGSPHDAKFGAYVNGVALFETDDCVVVTGYCIVESRSDAAALATVKGTEGAERKMSLAKFEMFVEKDAEST